MKLSYIFVALFFVLTFVPFTTSAQDSSGISITPATIEHAADKGEFIETQFSITNLSEVEQLYYISSRDISGVRDGNVPVYVDDRLEKTGFELSEWLELPAEPIVVQPGASAVIPIKVNVPENATPGDHFAGVFASVQPPKLRETGAGVGYDVASIVIIKINGQRVINAQIREFSTLKTIHGETDVDFKVRIQNTGTDIARPYGPLEVHNMFGSKTATLTFNENLGGVFPGTVRDFTLNWSDVNPGFGRYNARIALAYDGEGGRRTIDSTVSFWILPMNIIVPAAITLAVLLLVSYIAVKVYIRRAVREVSGSSARGRGQLVRRRRKSKQISALMLVSVVLLAVTAVFLILLLIIFS